ncbi:MAG: hypothetical protein JSS07_04030, partial [Proteobacteria bacterium]|nr:hypothetical protein [Pseudomonadota bacterium]
MISQPTKDAINRLYTLSNSIDRAYVGMSCASLLCVDIHLLSTLYAGLTQGSFPYLQVLPQILPHLGLLTLGSFAYAKGAPTIVENTMTLSASHYQKITNKAQMQR